MTYYIYIFYCAITYICNWTKVLSTINRTRSKKRYEDVSSKQRAFSFHSLCQRVCVREFRNNTPEEEGRKEQEIKSSGRVSEAREKEKEIEKDKLLLEKPTRGRVCVISAHFSNLMSKVLAYTAISNFWLCPFPPTPFQPSQGFFIFN